MSETVHPAPDGWLKRFFLSLVILALLAGLLLVPWAVCWLTASGELDQEEVVARQAQGAGSDAGHHGLQTGPVCRREA